MPDGDILFVAQRGADNPINVWLDNNPMVLGLIAIALGALLVLASVISLRTGAVKNRLGTEARGSTAQIAGYIRLLIGVVICAFGLYKMIMG